MIDALAPQGFVALVGAAAPGTNSSVDIGVFLINSPAVTAAIEGDAVPQAFVPHLVDLYERGRLTFDRQVKSYPFDQINQAFEDSVPGEKIKPVIIF